MLFLTFMLLLFMIMSIFFMVNSFMMLLLLSEFIVLLSLSFLTQKEMYMPLSSLTIMSSIILMVIESTLSLTIFMMINNSNSIFKSKM